MSGFSTPGEERPAELLRRCAAVLEAKHPKNTAWLLFDNQSVLAHVAWCGVIIVTDQATGKRLVQSMPGQPHVVDTRPRQT